MAEHLATFQKPLERVGPCRGLWKGYHGNGDGKW